MHRPSSPAFFTIPRPPKMHPSPAITPLSHPCHRSTCRPPAGGTLRPLRATALCVALAGLIGGPATVAQPDADAAPPPRPRTEMNLAMPDASRGAHDAVDASTEAGATTHGAPAPTLLRRPVAPTPDASQAATSPTAEGDVPRHQRPNPYDRQELGKPSRSIVLPGFVIGGCVIAGFALVYFMKRL